ncbi:MAG: 30S ribosomal protein S2 [Bdellovibrionales bacterium]|nr:30S ribosomal protein S2 [Bdellovibrionales bacterium]
MPEISMRNMLSAGVHYGHQTHRWNPKMRRYIFAPRNGIYIIDLEKTVTHAREACNFLKKVVSGGGKVLFVATKKQAKSVLKEAAIRAGMPYVSERWLGGTLTNFTTIRSGIERLENIERMKEDGTYQMLPKKETVRLERKRKKLELNLGGLRDMKAHPAALFVIDPQMEKNAVREANRLGIPVVALVDTNCDPDPIDYVIPGNDDAIKSVTLFANLIADACAEGGAAYEQRMRQHAPAPAAPAKEEETVEGAVEAVPAGPVVERVVRRNLKIPTEIDYRDDTGEEEEVAAAPVAEGEAEQAAEAKAGDEAKVAEDKKPAKKKKKAKDKE